MENDPLGSSEKENLASGKSEGHGNNGRNRVEQAQPGDSRKCPGSKTGSASPGPLPEKESRTARLLEKGRDRQRDGGKPQRTNFKKQKLGQIKEREDASGGSFACRSHWRTLVAQTSLIEAPQKGKKRVEKMEGKP